MKNRKTSWVRMPLMLAGILLIVMGMSMGVFAETKPSPSQQFSDLDLSAWYIPGTDYVLSLIHI